MQKQDQVQLNIEYLLHELASCINDLKAFSGHLSIDDVQQADISLRELSALITNHNQARLIRLSIV